MQQRTEDAEHLAVVRDLPCRSWSVHHNGSRRRRRLGRVLRRAHRVPAVVEGQPPLAVKQNSGYTLLYNAKSVNKNSVYVDALKCGSITRFISHSCDPNAAFVEQQMRSRVRVFVKMIKNVKAGAQVTVHYGNERWFTCACDQCWAPRVVEVSDSEEE
ncbi:hypothetical protein PF002_g29966 [Phytophthora fragariae]|uniref:SET domain-containing protein n=2 Tax=Phytophthora fragariae TaxID=53985 RepID=A0A6A3VTL8_9STRA|nr:hypothetical protein PF002_g29966 [Phytophthora fragariae]